MTASGKWNVVIESPLGKQHREMTMDAEGESFEARVIGPDGTSAVTGKIEGDRLTWSDKISKPLPLTANFDVTLLGDEMQGVVKLGIFGKAKFVATRAA